MALGLKLWVQPHDLGRQLAPHFGDPRTAPFGTRLHRAALLDGGPLEAFGHRLRDVLAAPMPMDETRALKPRRLDLSPDAKALLIDYANEVEAAQIKGGILKVAAPATGNPSAPCVRNICAAK